MKNFVFTGLILILTLAVLANCQSNLYSKPQNCEIKLTQKPEKYPKGSELYYLAWVEHGSYGTKAEAARRLLELKEKKELSVTEKVCLCEEEQVIKNIMILNLFDLQPEKYLKLTQNLLTEKDKSGLQDLEATWVKAGEDFDGKEVDFYFDWGTESALRLLKKGYFSNQSLEILFAVAESFYSSEREKAAKVFSLFEGLPTIDLTKQRERYDGENPFKEQLEIIKKWFQQNKSQIYWDSEKQKYFVKK